MNINRNNYEEYFLLYADNELSAAEKYEVELFVEQYPDLKQELNLILFTINTPDKNIKLADKLFLMKKENSSFINENNYEAIFVLYHDDELSAEQKKETEQFVKKHPQFFNEFDLIGKAKLIADKKIIYPDKKDLYRREKPGKVIPLILWRTVAAAVFIGFGFWTGLQYLNQKNQAHLVAIEQNDHQAPASTLPKVTIEKPADSENINSEPETKNALLVKENNEKIVKEKERKVAPRNENQYAVLKEKKKAAPEEKPIQVKKDDVEMLASNKTIKEVPKQIIASTILPKSNKNEHVDQIIQPSEPVNYAQNASYINNNQSDENYVFYNVTTEEFNKTKVGGFLKKVKRIVERTNPIAHLLSGDDKQVASK
jgi:hypothetical protein